MRLNKEKPQKGVLDSSICYTWEVGLPGEAQRNLSRRLVRTAIIFDYMQIFSSKTKHLKIKIRFYHSFLSMCLHLNLIDGIYIPGN